MVIFEMLAEHPPFFDENPFGIYEKTLSGKVEWPRCVRIMLETSVSVIPPGKGSFGSSLPAPDEIRPSHVELVIQLPVEPDTDAVLSISQCFIRH